MSDVGVKFFLEQARRITHNIVGQQRERCANTEILGPVGSPVKSYAPQDPTRRTSVAVGKNRTEELLDPMMTQIRHRLKNLGNSLKNAHSSEKAVMSACQLACTATVWLTCCQFS